MCCRNSVLLSYVSPLGLGFLEQEFLRGRRRPSGSLFRNLARFGVSAAHLMHSIDVNTTPVSACTPNWNLNPQDVENWDMEGVHGKFGSILFAARELEREDLATLILSRSKCCVIFFLTLSADDNTIENHFHVPLPYSILLRRARGLYCCDARTSELTSSRRVPSKKLFESLVPTCNGLQGVSVLGNPQST